eukprot:12378020-Ditylum_brightwellii.AAC.1
MPSHKTIELTGMSHDRFDFIWRHFHVPTDTENYQDDMSDIEDDSNEEEELIEHTLERVEAYEDVMDEDDSLLEISASDTCANNQPFGTSVSVDEDKEHPWNKHVWSPSTEIKA